MTQQYTPEHVLDTMCPATTTIDGFDQLVLDERCEGSYVLFMSAVRLLNQREEARNSGDLMAAQMHKALPRAAKLASQGWPHLAAFELGLIIDAYCEREEWLGPACRWVMGRPSKYD